MRSLKTIIAVVATGALLFGCSAPIPQNNIMSQTSVSGSSQTSVPGGQTQNNGSTSASSQTTSNGSAPSVPNGSLAEYQAAINSLTTAISTAQPPADYNSKYQEFSNYQSQINGIKNSLETYEGQLEYGRYTGNVDMSNNTSELIQVDNMEDQLDTLEDQLEMKYGIDD